MIFEKTVENNTDIMEDVYFEIEKDFKSDPVKGINVSMVGVVNEDLIANFTLSYHDALRLQSGLAKYIKEVHQQLIN